MHVEQAKTAVYGVGNPIPKVGTQLFSRSLEEKDSQWEALVCLLVAIF